MTNGKTVKTDQGDEALFNYRGEEADKQKIARFAETMKKRGHVVISSEKKVPGKDLKLEEIV